MSLKACATLLCLYLVASVEVKDFFTTQRQGVATYLSENGVGSCNNEPPLSSFTDSLVKVALNSIDYKSSASCGMCIEIQGDGTGSGSTPVVGTILGYVNSECPSCPSGTIGLLKNGGGMWGIKWKAISCPTNTALIYRLYQQGPIYKLHVSNHRQPIANVKVYIQSQQYQLIGAANDNFFYFPENVPQPLPSNIDILVTGLDGSVVSDIIVTTSLGVQFTGNKLAILPFYNSGPRVCSQDSDCPLPGDPIEYTKCNLNYNINGFGKCDVTCRVDSDCRFNNQDIFTFCVNGKCKSNACRINADCSHSTTGPICDTTINECRKCKTSTECNTHPAGRLCLTALGFQGFCGCNGTSDCVGKQYGTFCYTASHSCGCSDNTHCKVVNATACNSNTLTCGNCSTSADCSNHPNGTTCVNIPKAQCAAIDSSSCVESKYGSAVLGGVCGCRADINCLHLPKTPACDCPAGKCIECTKDHHCPSWKRCNDQKKCAALKCKIDNDCFRSDLRNIGLKPFGEARCNDKELCVETLPLCVAS